MDPTARDTISSHAHIRPRLTVISVPSCSGASRVKAFTAQVLRLAHVIFLLILIIIILDCGMNLHRKCMKNLMQLMSAMAEASVELDDDSVSLGALSLPPPESTETRTETAASIHDSVLSSSQLVQEEQVASNQQFEKLKSSTLKKSHSMRSMFKPRRDTFLTSLAVDEDANSSKAETLLMTPPESPKSIATKRKSTGDLWTYKTESTNDSVSTGANNKNFFRSFIDNAALRASEFSNKNKGLPPLNVFTTLPNNFRRFVMRVGPVAHFQDRVEDILLWRNTSETLIALMGFTIMCFNPLLVIFVPHLILVWVISSNYYANLKRAKSKKSAELLVEGDLIPAPSQSSSTRPSSISYPKNMQFIQNTMGMYVDAYESVCALNPYVNWSNPAQTAMILKLSLGSMLLLGVFGYSCFELIKWNYVVLVAGWAGILGNHPMGEAIKQMLMERFTGSTAKDKKKVSKKHKKTVSISVPSEQQEQQPKYKLAMVECVENQRYWAGMGWMSHLLKQERAPWSSLDGKTSTRSIIDLEQADIARMAKKGLVFEDDTPASNEVPQIMPSDSRKFSTASNNADLDRWSWEWMPGSEWQLDQSWSALDEEGWAYSDHEWKAPKKKLSSGPPLTRRRRWIRFVIGANTH